MRELDGALDMGGVEFAASHDEVQLDAREHLGIGVGAVGFQLNLAAAHVVSPLLQDEDDVVGRATACARQHQLHRTGSEIVSAPLWGAVHADEVATAGVGDETHGARAHPANVGFHGSVLDPRKRLSICGKAVSAKAAWAWGGLMVSEVLMSSRRC